MRAGIVSKGNPQAQNHIITIDYKQAVLDKLKAMRCGESRPLSPLHHGRFIEACKILNDWSQDQENGFIVEFSNDYKAVRKVCIEKPITPKQK